MNLDFTPRDLLATRHLRFTRTWLLVGVLLVCIVMLLSVISVPIPVKAIMLQDKIMHMCVYACLMGWFAQIFRHDLTRLLFVALFVCMGIAMEFIQGMVPAREFEVLDMVANTSGVLLAWALAYTWVGDLLVQIESRLSRRTLRA